MDLKLPPSDQPMPPSAGNFVPAATLVIFRQNPQVGQPPQLLMVERSPRMRFAAGASVFPGGRVDPADRELARALEPEAPLEMASARIAAIRETLEETGLLVGCLDPVTPEAAREGRALLAREGALAPVLARMGWTLAPDRLAFFAHWCPNLERAFDTRFFLADLGSGEVEIAVDETENSRLFWASAAQTLEMAENGATRLIFPTLRNLERLARFGSYAEALADVERHPPRRIQPRSETRCDGQWLAIPDDLGYPVCAQRLESVRRG
ncbi:NUDIX domain-containing protein [Novosphingobium profundi]|nr:NUDIX domain-containing protein [Novosphingobium profundi]